MWDPWYTSACYTPSGRTYFLPCCIRYSSECCRFTKRKCQHGGERGELLGAGGWGDGDGWPGWTQTTGSRVLLTPPCTQVLPVRRLCRPGRRERQVLDGRPFLSKGDASSPLSHFWHTPAYYFAAIRLAGVEGLIPLVSPFRTADGDLAGEGLYKPPLSPHCPPPQLSHT